MKGLVPLLLFVLFVFIGIVAVPNVGVTWDEPDNIYAGGVYVKFFRSGFNPEVFVTRDQSVWGDKIYSQEQSLHRYPPIPIYLGTILVVLHESLGLPVTSFQIIALFHIASMVFLALTVSGMYLWARLLQLSKILSLFAALTVGFYPVLYGTGLSNIKDSGQVAVFVWSLYILVYSLMYKKRMIFLAGAFVWGLALASKINAVYIPFIVGAWYFFRESFKAHSSNTKRENLKISVKIQSIILHLLKTIGLVSLLGAVGIAVMVVVWPYLWFDPVLRLIDAFRYFTTVGTGYQLYWDGARIPVGIGYSLWWYPFVHLLVSTPLPILFFASVGCIRVLRNVLPFSFVENRRGILILWFFFPLARAFFPSAAFYDGIRHFLEILPSLILFAFVGLETIGEALFSRIQKKNVQRIVTIGLPVVILLHVLFISYSLFPYTTSYVNFLVGNPNQLMDRDYGGLSVKEAMDRLHKKKQHMSVLVPIAGHLSWYYLEKDDTYAYWTDFAQAAILVNKSSHSTREEFEKAVGPDFELVDTVSRGRDIFAWIYLRKSK